MAWWNVSRFPHVASCAQLTCPSGPVKKAALQYYIDNFDFSGLRLDMAFRYTRTTPLL